MKIIDLLLLEKSDRDSKHDPSIAVNSNDQKNLLVYTIIFGVRNHFPEELEKK